MSPASRRLARLSVLGFSTLLSAFAQSVISTHSGVINYSEGSLFVADKQIDDRFGHFTNVGENQQLKTTEGRAEMLLTPGVFLRLGENSSVRMISTRLIDTRVEFQSGEVSLEADDSVKENRDNHVTIVYGDYTITPLQKGIFGFESNPAQLKVYSGQAEVSYNGNIVVVKEGRMLPFTPAMAMERFDNRDGDELYRWAKRRSEYVAVANVSAAHTANQSGNYYSTGSWYFNPFYSMYTYLPARGIFQNAFGYSFFSPYSVYSVYYPSYYGGGYGTTANNSVASRKLSTVPTVHSTTLSSIVSGGPSLLSSTGSSPVSSGGISRSAGGSSGGHAGGHGH